eukprot:2396928-Prorocentrum_lima.AAC.1
MLSFLVDNQCAVAVLSEGRSSSHPLNSALLRVAAFARFCGVVPYYGWVPSKDNPADAPSRWACQR